MNRLRGYLSLLLAMGVRGVVKTFYLNFRLLPFRQALRMPIYCTAYTKFHSLRGKAVFTCPVRHGLVRFGYLATNMFVPENNVTLLSINGELRFGGRGDFAPGVSIWVGNNATLTIGDEFFINARVKIVCHERMQIGEYARIAWETQIFDTKFHFIQDLATGEFKKKTGPVIIGNHVWIGNRSSIAPGVTIPNHCMVASHSLCTKDYTSIPNYSIIGGVPAKLIKSGFRRISSYGDEALIAKELGLDPE